MEGEIQGARGSGQLLDDSVKEPMEREFGADFSGVRVHTDAQADQLSQAIQAKAFTTGQDVFFRSGAYDPGSRGGQELLAHELTHVVQQMGEAGLVGLRTENQEKASESQRKGEQAKGESKAETEIPSELDDGCNTAIQREPINLACKPNDSTYDSCDSIYTGVKLQKVGTMTYKICNEGEYKDITVVYSIDDEQYFYKDSEGEYADYDRPFDISLVSNLKAAEASSPTVYTVGDEGKGVFNVAEDTTLRTTGLNTCVGWLLYNDTAAYLTHIVVLTPNKVKENGHLKSQTTALVKKFTEQTGTKPTYVRIHVDKSQPITLGNTIKLVVEVVSTNWQNDYARKVEDYAILGIPEYWIVDYLGIGGREYIGKPKQLTLTICTLVEDEYQKQLFRNDDLLISSIFPELKLTAQPIFNSSTSRNAIS